jgi:hypothetical protein
MLHLLHVQDGRTCLHIACNTWNSEVIQWCLDMGGKDLLAQTDNVNPSLSLVKHLKQFYHYFSFSLLSDLLVVLIRD